MNPHYESFRNAMADIAESWYAQSMQDDSDVDQEDNLEVRIEQSVIHGLGVMCNLQEGLYVNNGVILVRADGRRSRAGRYINHSATPNCKVVIAYNKPSLWAVATEHIQEHEELTINYAQAEPIRKQLAEMHK
jgi:hypothetical protein